MVDDYRKLLEDVTIDAVHICTPNVTHYQMALKDSLLAGKHVLCEKPLSVSAEEAQELVRLARERSLRNSVSAITCATTRSVQQIRRMREDGDLGEVLVAQGTYSQDWLLYESRLELADRREGGRSIAGDGRYRLALVRYGGTP